MSSTTSKNSILKKIRAALSTATPPPFPQSEGADSVYQPLTQDIVVEFAEQFTALGGRFAFCTGEEELRQQLAQLAQVQEWTRIFTDDPQWTALVGQGLGTDDIVTCDASITGCEALVARTGTIVLSARNSGRITSVYAPIHVCVAYTSQLVYDIKDALGLLTKKYKGNLPSLISFATGPSRTADIEKTLVVGVHGPKEVYLFLVDDLGEAS
ncbi:MAG: lactate utilization protein [Flaviaesturariibacter sp.]|nr:lactate utilization protein [Flaviaesturariibacter sp.]